MGEIPRVDGQFLNNEVNQKVDCEECKQVITHGLITQLFLGT